MKLVPASISLAVTIWLIFGALPAIGQTPESTIIPPGTTASFIVRICDERLTRCLVLGFTVASQATQSVTASFENSTLTLTAPVGAVAQILSGCVSDDGPPPVVHCKVGGLSSPPTVTITFTTMPAPTGPTPAPTGPTVTYRAGWNLVGAPAGTTFTQASNPLYNFPPGAAAYVPLPNTQPVDAGQGYWAFFSVATSVVLSGTSSSSGSVSAPAGQYVLIGNPSATQTLTIRGADASYTFNTAANIYTASAVLTPGQGAWVFSTAGGTVTVSP